VHENPNSATQIPHKVPYLNPSHQIKILGRKIDQTLNTKKHQAELAKGFQNSLTGLHATIESFPDALAPSKPIPIKKEFSYS
jgi:hypothetical protein